jgi:hypothetical protein
MSWLADLPAAPNTQRLARIRLTLWQDRDLSASEHRGGPSRRAQAKSGLLVGDAKSINEVHTAVII